MSSKKKNSFTLIELLVVIGIIGVLSGIIIVNVNSYTEKARDAKRVSDVKQLKTALNLYAADNNFNYPDVSVGKACIGFASGTKCWSGYLSGFNGDDNLNQALSRYINVSQILDPNKNRNIGDGYIYAKNAPADISCDGSKTIFGGTWIVWLPDKKITNRLDHSVCGGIGKVACCAPIGCHPNDFCVERVDQNF